MKVQTVGFGSRTIRALRSMYEAIAGEPLASVRMQAAAKAIGLALEYRVDLAEVREAI